MTSWIVICVALPSVSLPSCVRNALLILRADSHSERDWGAVPCTLCTGEPLSIASGCSPREHSEEPHGCFGIDLGVQGLCHAQEGVEGGPGRWQWSARRLPLTWCGRWAVPVTHSISTHNEPKSVRTSGVLPRGLALRLRHLLDIHAG